MATEFSSWDSYFWEPGGTVLRNLYGERDGAVLAQREYAETAKQQVKLDAGLVVIAKTYDAEHLRAIHKQLFANVYEWAGGLRSVGIRKGFNKFASPENVPRYLVEASQLVRSAHWSTMDRDAFASAAAEVFAHVNQGHPFREGNGRSSKIFMQHVAELSSFRLDYDPAVSGVTPEIWNQASMLSGPDIGRHEPVPESLVPVFRALAVERTPAAAPIVTDPGLARVMGRASFPYSATEATRARSDAGVAPRPASAPGRPYGVGRD
ncbi:Fic/DOC family protein [Sanguibacter antarcticus]|uniref:protein adenylyltransferase n=1 Tax=Sanguibacter antarcticus TaxID=372484 RepID=A0A2A9E2G1_9MICO|nr:Fic family protein [Sanguibacter antarcticus]PFG32370.1 cell filamentation protein [Sanguibacter antarcticus]